ncbi:MAG: cation:proton antiporter [Candidatus Kryptoniota bacterium]
MMFFLQLSQFTLETPFAEVLVYIVIILFCAKLGAELLERIGQPAVIGELVAGVILGNLVLINPHMTFFEPLRREQLTSHPAIAVDTLAQIGIILLLFKAGLESSVSDMRKIGLSALFVATAGVVAPFILGYLVSAIFITHVPVKILSMSPHFNLSYIHMFVGATLCATSVGITARVFNDMGKLQLIEARIILGAAVIDDILGLLVLSTVSGIVIAAESGTSMSPTEIIKLIGSALAFLVGSLIAGSIFVPRIMNIAARFRTRGLMLITSILICFGLAALASYIGLAPIVGAFAGGLILEEVHFKNFAGNLRIHDMIEPITQLFVPIFFVLMGIQVHLEAFFTTSVIGVSAGLIVAAVIGKQVCGLAVFKRGIDRLTVGIGMIPRGEVGLIFAGIGRSLGVVDDSIFSAIVIMVMVTTFITPPLLKFSISRSEKRALEI